MKREICKRENRDPVLKNVAEYSALLELRRRWDAAGILLGILCGLAAGVFAQKEVLSVVATVLSTLGCSVIGRVVTRNLRIVRERLPDPMKPLIDPLLQSRRWRRAAQ